MLSTDAPQIIEHINQGLTFTPSDTKWIPASPRFVVLGQNPKGTGALHVYELDTGECRVLHKFEKAHGLKCGTFGASSLEERRVATGDYSGQVAVWDFERDTPLFSAPKAHAGLVNAIDGCGGLNIGGGAPELVTGGADGAVRVWDPRVPDCVMALEPAAGESKRDCWAVAFGNSYNDSERCIAAGYDNGDVKLFDLRSSSMRWETNVSNGVVALEFDRKDIAMNKLLVTTLESKFRVYDMRTQHPVDGFAHVVEKAHKSTVWMGRHLPQNRELFITTGGNGGINVYKYHYPAERAVKDTADDAGGRMRGVAGTVELLNARIVSSQPIVSWDWSPDKEGLSVASCLDQTLRVFIVTKLHKY